MRGETLAAMNDPNRTGLENNHVRGIEKAVYLAVHPANERHQLPFAASCPALSSGGVARSSGPRHLDSA